MATRRSTIFHKTGPASTSSVRRTLVRIGYDGLRRSDKGAVRKYLAKKRDCPAPR